MLAVLRVIHTSVVTQDHVPLSAQTAVGPSRAPAPVATTAAASSRMSWPTPSAVPARPHTHARGHQRAKRTPNTRTCSTFAPTKQTASAGEAR